MRLAFITTMRTESDIYFLDEILAVGDTAFRDICKEEFRMLREKGKTVLLVNHGLQELQEFSDRILFMEAGRIISEEKAPSQEAAF